MCSSLVLKILHQLLGTMKYLIPLRMFIHFFSCQCNTAPPSSNLFLWRTDCSGTFATSPRYCSTTPLLLGWARYPYSKRAAYGTTGSNGRREENLHQCRVCQRTAWLLLRPKSCLPRGLSQASLGAHARVPANVYKTIAKVERAGDFIQNCTCKTILDGRLR